MGFFPTAVPGAGLTLTNHIHVKGMAISGFDGFGVAMNGDDNILSCSWIGTADGLTSTAANGSGGITISGSNNHLGIAGDTKSGNLIVANGGPGIRPLSGSNNHSDYSWVGLDHTGAYAASLLNAQGALKVVSGANLLLGPGNRFQS